MKVTAAPIWVGFTVAVGEWSAVPHDQGIGTGKSWYADFAVTVRVHNLDNSNGFSFPAKSVFVLKIDGQKVALQGGNLLSNITLVMKKGERKTGVLTFRLDESQKISIRQWKLKPQISSLGLA